MSDEKPKAAAEPEFVYDAENDSIEYNGETYINSSLIEEPEPTLANYEEGDKVFVLARDLRWHDGFIQNISEAGIQVHTDRGPVTIKSSNNIKPRAN